MRCFGLVAFLGVGESTNARRGEWLYSPFCCTGMLDQEMRFTAARCPRSKLGIPDMIHSSYRNCLQGPEAVRKVVGHEQPDFENLLPLGGASVIAAAGYLRRR